MLTFITSEVEAVTPEVDSPGVRRAQASARRILKQSQAFPAGVVRQFSVSLAQIDRLTRVGLPYVPVGDLRRFDIGICRAWLAERGQCTAASASIRHAGIARSSGLELRESGLGDVRSLSRGGARS